MKKPKTVTWEELNSTNWVPLRQRPKWDFPVKKERFTMVEAQDELTGKTVYQVFESGVSPEISLVSVFPLEEQAKACIEILTKNRAPWKRI